MNNDNRVLSRQNARELTPAEVTRQRQHQHFDDLFLESYSWNQRLRHGGIIQHG